MGGAGWGLLPLRSLPPGPRTHCHCTCLPPTTAWECHTYLTVSGQICFREVDSLFMHPHLEHLQGHPSGGRAGRCLTGGSRLWEILYNTAILLGGHDLGHKLLFACPRSERRRKNKGGSQAGRKEEDSLSDRHLCTLTCSLHRHGRTHYLLGLPCATYLVLELLPSGTTPSHHWALRV